MRSAVKIAAVERAKGVFLAGALYSSGIIANRPWIAAALIGLGSAAAVLVLLDWFFGRHEVQDPRSLAANTIQHQDGPRALSAALLRQGESLG